MSVNLHVYVGPYFRVFNPVVEKPVPISHACQTVACKQHGKVVHGRFCSSCGQPSGTVQSKKAFLLFSDGDVRAAFEREDAMTPIRNGSGPIVKSDNGEVQLWTPNQKRHNYDLCREDIFAEFNGSKEVPMDENTIAKEKAMLRESYSKEYDALARLFGNVDVAWGVIQYWW